MRNTCILECEGTYTVHRCMFYSCIWAGKHACMLLVMYICSYACMCALVHAENHVSFIWDRGSHLMLTAPVYVNGLNMHKHHVEPCKALQFDACGKLVGTCWGLTPMLIAWMVIWTVPIELREQLLTAKFVLVMIFFVGLKLDVLVLSFVIFSDYQFSSKSTRKTLNCYEKRAKISY